MLVGLRQVARHRQNQGHRQVGHVIGQHAGGVRHRHTVADGGRDVNAVIAHAKHRQHLELRQLRDQAARHHGFTGGGQTHDFGRQRRHSLCVVGLKGVHLVGFFQCRDVQRVHFGHGQNVELGHRKSSFEWQINKPGKGLARPHLDSAILKGLKKSSCNRKVIYSCGTGKSSIGSQTAKARLMRLWTALA